MLSKREILTKQQVDTITHVKVQSMELDRFYFKNPSLNRLVVAYYLFSVAFMES